MEEKWLSVAELSTYTKVPESSARRYLSKFTRFFYYKKRSRGKKYHPRSVFVLEKISMLYDEGYESEEIEKILSDEFGFAFEEDEKANEPTFLLQFDEFKKQQHEFNKVLIERLEEQQKFLHNALKECDKKMNEIRDYLK